MSKVETLICERGDHMWKRVSTRGRKPRTCPVDDCYAGKVAQPTDEPEARPSVALETLPGALADEISDGLYGDAVINDLLPALSGSARAARLMDMMSNRTRYGRKSK